MLKVFGVARLSGEIDELVRVGVYIVKLFGGTRRAKGVQLCFVQFACFTEAEHGLKRRAADGVGRRGAGDVSVPVAYVFELLAADGAGMIVEVVPVVFGKGVVAGGRRAGVS